MLRQASLALFLFSVLASTVACSIKQQVPPTPAPASVPSLPNPASAFCEQNSGKLSMREDANGGVAGICVFADGSQCDEWAFYRGECKPGSSPPDSAASSPTTAAPSLPSTAAVNDGWKLYQNQKLGYTLQYPPNTTLSTDEQPGTVTVAGPVLQSERWPMIYLSHPTDRQDYRPPKEVDLEKWLTQHNLLMTDGRLGEARQRDIQIAGTKAIHTRFARSPQSYAYDKYFFARSGQLYTLVILHTGDKEDWGLYNRFIASIRFGS